MNCRLSKILLSLSTCLIASNAVWAQEATPRATTNATAEVNPQEKEIRADIQAFVDAYNKKDAKQIASLFLEQAYLVDERDDVVQGRANIESTFASLFAGVPDSKIETNVESIRFLTSNLAVELGSTAITFNDGTVEYSRYSCVHVLDGKDWKMGLVRDIALKPSHRDHLAALSWMVGEWVDENDGTKVRTHCEYVHHGSFLLQNIIVENAGQVTLTMQQRIGWDPIGQRFKSWVFDSEGGYGEANWTPTENGWLLKFTGVNSDGQLSSATNHIQPLGVSKYVFESVDRVVGNQLMPALKIQVVKQPPKPKSDTPEATTKK
ncbi:MAG: SgcJ/EcaC family oxidoreductase [Planctomycetaceae bacterium]|nr:SgcJ/EcaC family oxidoreductase [Planctomycetaceae bacterium]